MGEKVCQSSRREFIKAGVAAAAGLSFFPSPLKSKNRGKEDTGKNGRKIIYRILGRTGLKVSVVGLGAAYPEVMRAALDAGINYLDTAERYGGGYHEIALGEVLKGRPRDSFVAVTKILGLRDNRTGLPPKNTTPAEFRADFRQKMETSLKRLQLDDVDILFLHGVDRPELLGLPMIKDVMIELKEEGKTRFLGASFHHKELELIPATAREKIYDVILTSYNFRQPHRDAVREAISKSARDGVGFVAMKVMAGAYWDKERRHPINARAALKWILQDHNVQTTIPSAANFGELEKDLSVMEDLNLTAQEEEDLRFGEKTGMAGLYCAQCGQCRSQCRFNLEIPTAMRAYMYAFGYRNPALAKTTLLKKPVREITCRSCRTCAVNCSLGFDVSRKIRDVVRVLGVPDEFLASCF